MTLLELYKAVSQLGFEDSLGDDGTSRFIYATNRALLEIDSIRPRRKRVDVNHRVPENLLFSEPVTIEKTEPLIFTANGAKSYYFEVCGEGEFYVRCVKVKITNDGKKLIEYDQGFLTEFKSKSFEKQKGFIKFNGAFIDKMMESNSETNYYTGEVQICFGGDYDYTIRNLAFYDRVYSAEEDDIVPFAKTVGYNAALLTDDFGTFDTPPLDSNGMHLFEGYSIDGSTVYLPANKQGVYTVNYLHKVALVPLTASINGAPIDIDLEDDLAALLPNLIAAYVWLDDEPEKSQYYYNLYLARADQIKRQTNNLNPIEFKSVYGW
jgi:hypothetical protein